MKVYNPTTGCNKVSQGCKNCYAEIMHNRLMHIPKINEKYNRPFLDGAFPHEPSLSIPFSWKKGSTVFVDSMSDLFHGNIPVEYIAKVYAVMFLNPQHTFQLLTKRPDRRLEILESDEFFQYLHKYCNQFHDEHIKKLESEMYFYDEIKSLFPFKNVWEGTSIEDQDTANLRIPFLMKTPAQIHWISAEPLLGPVDLDPIQHASQLDWIVTGGESGRKKRLFDADWARQIRDYCKRNEISFFMKQMDKVQSIPDDLYIREYPSVEKTHVSFK